MRDVGRNPTWRQLQGMVFYAYLRLIVLSKRPFPFPFLADRSQRFSLPCASVGKLSLLSGVLVGASQQNAASEQHTLWLAPQSAKHGGAVELGAGETGLVGQVAARLLCSSWSSVAVWQAFFVCIVVFVCMFVFQVCSFDVAPLA